MGVRVEENVTTKTAEEIENLAQDLIRRGFNLYSLTEDFAKRFNCNAKLTYDRGNIVLNLQ